MSERDEALKDLDDWEQGLTERLERGELTAWEALGELTDIKLTRLKILGVPPTNLLTDSRYVEGGPSIDVDLG